jgi:hypothetical protein
MWLLKSQLGNKQILNQGVAVMNGSITYLTPNTLLFSIAFFVKSNALLALIALLSSWMVLTNSMLSPNNPPVAKTGAPGENTCSTTSGCHSGGNFVGTVTLSGLPDTVQANQTYNLTLTNASDAVRAGFQLTSWDQANAMSGTLTAGTGVNIGSGTAGKQYARQSAPKNLIGGSTSWSFSWKAPATASGNKISFYFVSLCANNAGGKSGDNVIQANKSVVLQSTSASKVPFQEAAVKFYPTLVQQNTLHIELLDATTGQILIFDLNGKLLLNRTLSATNDLNVNDLPKGLFTAQILVNGKSIAKKFIVE